MQNQRGEILMKHNTGFPVFSAKAVFRMHRAVILLSASDPVENAVNKIMNKFIRTAKAIATPLGVISLVGCAITFFWSTDQRSVDKAKSWFFRVLIALILIYTAEPIIREIIELAESIGR